MEISAVQSIRSSYYTNGISAYQGAEQSNRSGSRVISFSNAVNAKTSNLNKEDTPMVGMDVYSSYLSRYLKQYESQSLTVKQAEKNQNKVVDALESEIRRYEMTSINETSGFGNISGADDGKTIISDIEKIQNKVRIENKNLVLLSEKLKAYRMAREANDLERKTMIAESSINLVA